MELTGPWKTISRARELRRQMSLPERLLWNALRKKQSGLRFRRQHPAGPYILDFYCESAKFCIEVDGESHNFTGKHDAARDRWLMQRGVRTLRLAARDVLRDLDAVVRYILIEAQAPSASLCSAPPPEGGGIKYFCESNA